MMHESALQTAARIMMEQKSRHAIAQERLHEKHERDLKELLLTGLRCGAAASAAGDTIDNVKAKPQKSVSEQALDADEGLGALRARLFNLVAAAEPADQDMKEFEEWQPNLDGVLASSRGGAATEPEAEAVFANNPYVLEENSGVAVDADAEGAQQPESVHGEIDNAEEAQQSLSGGLAAVSQDADVQMVEPVGGGSADVVTMSDSAESDSVRDSESSHEDVAMDRQVGPAPRTEQTEQEEEADDDGFQPARSRRRPGRSTAAIFSAEEIESAVAYPVSNHQLKQLRAARDSRRARLRDETNTEAIQTIGWSISQFSRAINLELQARKLRPSREARRQH